MGGAYAYLVEDEMSDHRIQSLYDWNHYKHEYFSEIQSTSTTPQRRMLRDYYDTYDETRHKTIGEYRNEAKSIMVSRVKHYVITGLKIT